MTSQAISSVSALSLLCLVACAAAAGPVTTGSSALRDSGFATLSNHRVAVLSNPTGVFADTMEHIVGEMDTYCFEG